MKPKGRSSEPGARRIPLVFGVSGHRDPSPADLPALREQLRSLFARFRAAYPSTPFKLLTPLAEGADRLAAEAALAAEVELWVPLPMKQREYERDFTTRESLMEFRALLAKAESYWEPMATGVRSESRTTQYAEVGDFIARSSHVLILLWDGKDNRKIGGTACEQAPRTLGQGGLGTISWRRSNDLWACHSGRNPAHFRKSPAAAGSYDR